MVICIRAGLYQQKNGLWIEFDRLRVKLSALFPLSLPARHTAEILRSYSVIWILPANRFELDLRALIITFEEIFVKTICQLRLDQVRPELHGHVESLPREVASLRGRIDELVGLLETAIAKLDAARG